MIRGDDQGKSQAFLLPALSSEASPQVLFHGQDICLKQGTLCTTSKSWLLEGDLRDYLLQQCLASKEKERPTSPLHQTTYSQSPRIQNKKDWVPNFSIASRTITSPSLGDLARDLDLRTLPQRSLLFPALPPNAPGLRTVANSPLSPEGPWWGQGQEGDILIMWKSGHMVDICTRIVLY